MRLPTPAERCVLLLQRAAIGVFGPRGPVAHLHTGDADPATTAAVRNTPEGRCRGVRHAHVVTILEKIVVLTP